MGKNLPPPAPRRPAVVPVADPIAAEAFVTGAPSALGTPGVPKVFGQPESLSALKPLETPSELRALDQPGAPSPLRVLEPLQAPSALEQPSALETPEPSNDSSEPRLPETPGAPGTPNVPSVSVSRRKLVSRSDGRQVRRLVAYFDPTLAKSLERWCVDHEMDVSAGIVEAVRRMLGAG
jgi:hypothetical protein